ncbi:hypothetical protein F5Y17DRAFT_238680 [Xylariaceae sp. FL0594]|nr:hypothetical protein F5Y17DRAFT_238680 [Xylariaceae sp. FL0594]
MRLLMLCPATMAGFTDQDILNVAGLHTMRQMEIDYTSSVESADTEEKGRVQKSRVCGHCDSICPKCWRTWYRSEQHGSLEWRSMYCFRWWSFRAKKGMPDTVNPGQEGSERASALVAALSVVANFGKTYIPLPAFSVSLCSLAFERNCHLGSLGMIGKASNLPFFQAPSREEQERWEREARMYRACLSTALSRDAHCVPREYYPQV